MRGNRIQASILVGAIAGAICLAGCSSQDTANLKQDTQQLGRDIAPIPANAALKTKVEAHLSLIKGVEIAKIHVDAENKVVTVSGNVTDAATRDRVVQAVQETSGVEKVEDKLQVGK